MLVRFASVIALLGSITATQVVNASSIKTSFRSSIEVESNKPRKLRQDVMADYVTATSVTDYAIIDKDLAAIEDELDKLTDENFQNALSIYEDGGYSKSYAEVTLGESPNTYVLKETEFTGKDSNGNEVVGKSYLTQQRTLLRLRYVNTEDDGAHYEGCQVGALPLINAHNTDKCLAANGFLTATLTGDFQTFSYAYNPLTDNKNARSFQDFSGLLQTSSIDCSYCPFDDAQYAVDYYGTAFYGDEWIQAAFASKKTSFTMGNADFSNYQHVGRGQCIKKAAVFMNSFMYVLREFEDAVHDCKSNVNVAVRNWDEGVALYIGSLEGDTGSSNGRLLYRVADKHCIHFKTCGKSGNEENGRSKVNYDLLELFSKGQNQILSGNCVAAKRTKKRIAELMYIPLIQGTLRNAYQVHYQDGSDFDKSEGAVFAASVLPRVHAARKKSAEIIYDNMRVGATSTTYEDVADAFQSVYKKLNLKCSQIGGQWDKSSSSYYKNASPCQETKREMLGIILGASFGAVVIGAIATVVYLYSKRKDERELY